MTKILTGLQPSGTLHLGNLLGSILPWHGLVNKEVDPEAYLMIVDQHSITVKQDPESLKKQIYELAATLLASGVDYKKHIVFAQSQNPDHAYVGWMFQCLTPMSWLDKMTQFKDKKTKFESYKEAVGTGLYTYPALMAADILLYDVDTVPVGSDQKQHVELTCNIANRFNSQYGQTFKTPRFETSEEATRIYDLQNPTKKMSKSDRDDAGRISLTDPVDVIRKKIMRAVTDNDSLVAFDQVNKPGVSNLLAIFAAVTNRSHDDLVTEYGTQGYGTFKSAVADAVIAYLEPFQLRMNEFLNDKDQMRMILDEGATRANEVSHPKTLEAAAKMGLYVHE
ncbi:tryptophan--tRNA ligase [bacterium]|nr:tryptophan--tRNA ligase [bacterium]